MPRPPRIHIPGGYYHVTMRGNHQEPLFDSSDDRRVLDDFVASALGRFGARLHAYCWMTNHLHALVQVSDRPLGRFVQSVAGRYSRYRQKLLGTGGHLFERRHSAKLVDVDRYFATLLRYIHLNPVKAGLADSPAAYPWSSHRAYIGTERIPWLTVSVGLSLFDNDPSSARRTYRCFVERTCWPEEGDGLESITHPADPRVLGDDAFLERTSNAASAPPRSDLTLDELAARICSEHGVSCDRLRSSSRQRDLMRIRRQLLDEAIALGIANVAAVARYLHRDPSTLARMRSRG